MKLFRTILIIAVFFCSIPAMAYQTVTMDFPGNWYKLRYLSNENDAIVQFVRQGYNQNTWQESVVFHTFKWSKNRNTSAKDLMFYLLNDARKKNPSMKVEYIKVQPEETLTSWCAPATKNTYANCEILRTTQSFEGALSMHYINKDIKNFNYVKQDWINRMNKARIYQSYFRLDRIMNKSMTFEL